MTAIFDEIYQRFRLPILRYVLQRVQDRHVAEELTQDTFLKAYRSRDSFDGSRRASTWLWTIARNTLADWFRANRGRREAVVSAVGGNALGDFGADSMDAFPSTLPDPETLMAEKGNREELARRTAALTDLQRRALTLRFVEHLPYRQIANELGLTLASAKCLVQRAKAATKRY